MSELLDLAMAPRPQPEQPELSDRHARFVDEFLIDFDAKNAALRAGFRSPLAGAHLLKRMDVRIAIRKAQLDRSRRVQFTADHVLLALVAQLGRLTAMLGHNLKEIYDDHGSLKPIQDWPEHWGSRLITEIESREESVRSHDGEDAEGRGGWDAGGVIRKVKRESTLAIERQIRETLAEIGRHVNVKAFEQPKGGDVNITIVTAEQARKIAGARKRLERVTGSVTKITGGEQ